MSTKNHHPRLRDVSAEGQQQITARSGTTVAQNGVSGFHYLQEWSRGESSGAVSASAPTRPRCECCARSQGMWVCSGLWGSSASPPWAPALRASFPALKSWGMGRSREKLVFNPALWWLDSFSCPSTPRPAPGIAVFPYLLFISCPVPGYLSPHLRYHQDENVFSFFAVLLMLCNTWNGDPGAAGKDPDLYHCALSKNPWLGQKPVYLISLAERS